MPTGIYTRTEVGKRNMSLAFKGKKNPFWGKKHSEKTLNRLRDVKLGWKHSEKTRLEMSKQRSGSKHWYWKGGITPANVKIRHSHKYREWRKAVFSRDNHKCVWCGSETTLNADHIKPFSTHIKLRFKLSNGRTLCFKCHKLRHSPLKARKERKK